MSLIKHADRELKLAGLFDKDSDYDGMLGKAVLDLVKVFAKQGHSGFSAHRTLLIFGKVAKFENLTPITSKSDEWMKVDDKNWQSKRNPSLFSKDGGKTWHDINKSKKEAKND